VLALVYAGLNLFKPLHVDDGAYYYYARQLAAHPLDPYGFQVFWYEQPLPANEVLAPPVLPASWAIGMALFGDRPWLCKLVLVPWVLLLAWALHRLTRRFARGLEEPALLLILLSPALLPSLNFMLDVPELALGLASVAVFLQACARGSWSRAALAGLLAGLAMQTKYTGFVVPGVLLVAALVWRRLRLWPVAALVAVQVFAAWELLMALRYGQSHFLVSVRGSGTTLLNKLGLGLAFLGDLGGLLPAVFLLALAALGVRGRTLLLAAGGLLAGYGVIVAAGLAGGESGPVELSTRLGSVSVAGIVFFIFAEAGLGAIALLVYRRLGEEDESRRRTLFLLGWLGMEVAGYFLLSPFPGVRRLLGVVVVLTLLTARLAVPSCAAGQRRRWVEVIAAAGVILGLGHAVLDFREAQAQEEAVREAARWIQQHGGGRIWFVGHWGFQADAERLGMESVVTLDSRLHRGDWLIAPDPARLHVQSIDWQKAAVTEEAQVVLKDGVPLRTLWCFYGGGVPVESHSGPRLVVRVCRVRADFTPRPAPD
jgi:4-amino-4-deoxy-L-arabinose transferase-like glycosyltransferase